MTWLDRVRGWLRSEQRSLTLADFPQLLLNQPVAAGVAVTERTALEYPPFRNGVVLISGDVGKIPRHPYERQEDGSRKRLDGTYLDRLLRQPNPYINDLDLWATVTAHALVWGDGYLEIEWDNASRPIALWPVTPDKITPVMDGQRLRYKYQGVRTIEAEDILHVKGPSFDGLKGDRPVTLARFALGLGIAAERYGAGFFANGAWPGVILEHPGELTEKAKKETKAAWDGMFVGPERTKSTAVLSGGMKANVLTTDQKDSQFTETRDFQVVEAARVLNLPPHKLKHKMGERPGNNLTESELDYLAGTLDPWLTRIEQECNLKLIPRAQRSSWYIEHDRNAYLRMTPEAKAQSYKAYYDMGVLSADQIATKENLPKPEPDEAPAPVVASPQPALPAATSNGRIMAAQRALVVEAVGLFIRAEANEARRAAKKGSDGFEAWVEEFYQRKADVLAGSLAPLVEFHLAQVGLSDDSQAVARTLAVGHSERSKDDLLDLRKDDLEGQVDRLMERWKLVRPGEMADRILAIGRKSDAA